MKWERIFVSNAPTATVLVRLLVGLVFLSEGIQKFLFREALGVGRFIKIGIPAAAVMAPLVGTVEITCGVLVVVGLLTRLAAVPLVGVISVAIMTTKLAMLNKSGFWTMAHEGRIDFAMLLGLVAGAGPLSLDASLMRRRRDE